MPLILVIEDNPANLELMLYLLQSSGYDTLSSCDGEEGIAVALRERPALIVCDLQLPKLDGFEVARRIKSGPLRDIPLVAVTAFAMVGDRDRVLAAGFDGYIPKPIAPDRFAGQVAAFLPTPEASVPGQLAPTVSRADSSSNPRALILVVDNSPANIELARSTLEPFGYEILSAYNVSDALALARQTAPDLILSEMHTPRESGYDLMKAARADEQLSRIPFVLISSVELPESDGSAALRSGADKFILRPIEPQALIAALEECIQKSRG